MYNCTKKLTCRGYSLPFCNWKSLLNHCEIVHPKIKCKICHSFFTSEILFEQHMKRYHNSRVTYLTDIYICMLYDKLR